MLLFLGFCIFEPFDNLMGYWFSHFDAKVEITKAGRTPARANKAGVAVDRFVLETLVNWAA